MLVLLPMPEDSLRFPLFSDSEVIDLWFDIQHDIMDKSKAVYIHTEEEAIDKYVLSVDARKKAPLSRPHR